MSSKYSPISIDMDFSLENIQSHNNQHLDFSMSSIFSKEQFQDKHKQPQNSSKNSQNQSHNKTKNTQGTNASSQHKTSNLLTVKHSNNKLKDNPILDQNNQNKNLNINIAKKKKILIKSQSDTIKQIPNIDIFSNKKQAIFTKRKLLNNKEETKKEYYYGIGNTMQGESKNSKSKGKINNDIRVNSVMRVRASNYSNQYNQNLNFNKNSNRFRQNSRSSRYSKNSYSQNKNAVKYQRRITNKNLLKTKKVEENYDIGRYSTSCKKSRKDSCNTNSRKISKLNLKSNRKNNSNDPFDQNANNELKKSQQTQIMCQYFGYDANSKNSLSHARSQLNIHKESNNGDIQNDKSDSNSIKNKNKNRSKRHNSNSSQNKIKSKLSKFKCGNIGISTNKN